VTGRRISPDHRSGQAILDPEFFTLAPRGESVMENQASSPILGSKLGSSPRNVPAGENPPEKRGPTIFFPRRESAVWKAARLRSGVRQTLQSVALVTHHPRPI
jgi:hypothetical protein